MTIFLTDYRIAATDNIKFIDDVKFPQEVHIFEDSYNRVKLGLNYPPHRIAERVLDLKLAEQLKQEDCRSAFILASGNSHFAGIPNKPYDNSLSYIYKILPLSLTQIYAGRTAQLFGPHKHITTDASACASSLKVLMDVQNLINNYRFDRVIVLSVEDAVSNSVLEFFGEARASITPEALKAGILPSAFDKTNHSFRVGQGAVLAVFESSAYQAKTGHRPRAELLGAYSGSEQCNNAIGQRDDGQGYTDVIRGVCEFNNIDPRSIKIVKTHGTGTQSNNAAEKAGVNNILNDYVATSFKPQIGHTLGASGLLETCLLLDNLEQGIIPKIANRTEKDSIFLSEDQEYKGGNILSLAAGMGNIYSAAVFRKV
jgi:3-oxoacyl-(acyl-carrier-protein) synthase